LLMIWAAVMVVEQVEGAVKITEDFADDDGT
jgi:hypothetical protein